MWSAGQQLVEGVLLGGDGAGEAGVVLGQKQEQQEGVGGEGMREEGVREVGVGGESNELLRG